LFMRQREDVNTPLTVTRDCSATPEQVWAVIADGWTFRNGWWAIAACGRYADWPAPGSKIHHTIGIWPLSINDETIVEGPVHRRVAGGRPGAAALPRRGELHLAAVALRRSYTLPPRAGGAAAAVSGAPTANVLVLTHNGFCPHGRARTKVDAWVAAHTDDQTA
jgi:hypothetical protein